MKYIAVVFYFAFAFIAIPSCKKEKDTRAPYVNLISPIENQNFSVGESIPVKFEISDDTRIEYAQLSVSDLNGIQVVSSVTYHDLENGQLVEHLIEIDNTGLQSGNYFLSVRTSDGENQETFFKKIYITELPITRKAIYFVGNQAGQHKVFKVDSSNTISTAYQLNADYLGSTIDSKNQKLITVGAFSGKLQCTNLFDYTEAWSENPIGSAYPTYRSISQGLGLNFVSYTSGFIKGFDYSGAVVFTASSNASVFYPLKSGISSKYVLSEQAAFVGATRKLVLYNYPSGSAKQETTSNGEVVEIFAKSEDDFFVFYNQGSTGKLSLYSASGNGFSYTFPYSLNGKVLSVVQLSATIYLIGTENGIYKYTYLPQNYVLFKAGLQAEELRYDFVNSQIIGSEGKQIKIFDYPSGMLIQTLTSMDSIVDVQLQYSR